MTARNTARYAESVTPSDVTDFSRRCSGIFVGVSGNVSVAMDGDGATVTFQGLAAGIIHPIEARRVNSTGTTASNMVAVFDLDPIDVP